VGKEKCICYIFGLFAMFAVAAETWIQVRKVRAEIITPGEISRVLDISIKVFLLLSLFVSELCLESKLRNNFPVQFIKHKFYLRNQLFWLILSLLT
jgi:hypothetical protein